MFWYLKKRALSPTTLFATEPGLSPCCPVIYITHLSLVKQSSRYNIPAIWTHPASHPVHNRSLYIFKKTINSQLLPKCTPPPDQHSHKTNMWKNFSLPFTYKRDTWQQDLQGSRVIWFLFSERKAEVCEEEKKSSSSRSSALKPALYQSSCPLKASSWWRWPWFFLTSEGLLITRAPLKERQDIVSEMSSSFD